MEKYHVVCTDGPREETLPSRFQHGDYCWLKMQSGHYSHSTVVGIKFTKSKVLYDVDVQVVPMHSEYNKDGQEALWTTSRLHGVDSDLLITPQEYESLVKDEMLKNYTLGELVSFGNYVLSGKKTSVECVSHADLENWKEEQRMNTKPTK